LPPLAAEVPKLAVAYHSACSMQHGQKLDHAPRALLAAAGFAVKEIAEGHLCCGSAGTYNVLQPELAARLRDRIRALASIAQEQQINPETVDEADVFALFADAGNLEAITPPALCFEILTPRPIPMRAGTLIDYRLRLFGVPFDWRTRIETFEPLVGFTDVQVRGPYRRWHHRHDFYATASGTLVIDTVDYELPLGPLGTVAHALFVRRALDEIFAFRLAAIDAHFGAATTSGHST
jgi:ligand-binding SRPBCC domain-containing protein